MQIEVTQPVTSPRRRDVSRRDVARARDLSRRAARNHEIRRIRPLPEPPRLELYRRVGRRLTPTADAVYALLRGADAKLRDVTGRSKAGCHVTVGELAGDVGRSVSSVRRALRQLEALELVVPVRQFEDAEWSAVAWGPAGPRLLGRYRRRQLASVYLLGRQATRAVRSRRRRLARPGGDRHPGSALGMGGQFDRPTSPPLKGRRGGPPATPPSARTVDFDRAAPPSEESPAGTESVRSPAASSPAAPPTRQAAPGTPGADRAPEGGGRRDRAPEGTPDGGGSHYERPGDQARLDRAMADALASFELHRGGGR